MRAKQNILRAVIVVAVAVGLISLIGSCRKKGPVERLGGKVDRAVDEASEAVEDAADKVKEAGQDAADKVKEIVDDAANNSDETAPSASEGAGGNAEQTG